uniref:Putative conserved secreted protein n=1 Tax=Culex tarsalis TaxID=7177 RepID=A0A1Q3FZQ5_CULTA
MVSANIIVFCIISLKLWKCDCSPLPWQLASLTDDGPNVHDYVNYDDLSFSKESGVFETVTDTNPDQAEPIHVHAVVKRSDVSGPRLQSVALIIPSAVASADDDMEVAETHLFRPVFRYKSQYTERRRVRQLPGQFGAVVVQ